MAESNPIKIPVEVEINGLTKIKQELKALKGELVNATDPAEVERLSQAIGQLSDKIADANDKAKIFAAGSDFEKVSNGISLIGDQLSNLDFEGAAETAQLLTKTIKDMNPATLTAGLKDLGKTVLQLGKAFVTMGTQLLKNPYFLLAAITIAIVVAIVKLKDTIVPLAKAFDLLMKPINLLIQGLKDLGDWLGLTEFAAKEEAEAFVTAQERKSESVRYSTDLIESQFNRQLELMKAQGKNTETFQINFYQEEIIRLDNRNKELEENYNKRYNIVIKGLKDEEIIAAEAADKTLQDNLKEGEANLKLKRDYESKIQIIKATSETKQREETKKHNKEVRKTNKQHNEQVLKDTLEAQRLLEDLVILNMKDGLEKELAEITKNEKRKIENIKVSGKLKEDLTREFNREANILSQKAYEREFLRIDNLSEAELDALIKDNERIKEYGGYFIDYNKNIYEAKLDIQKKSLNEQIKLLEDGLKNEIYTTMETIAVNEKLHKLKMNLASLEQDMFVKLMIERSKLEKDMYKEVNDFIFDETASNVGKELKVIGDSYDEKLKLISDNKDKQLKLIEGQYKTGILNEATFNHEKLKLNKEYDTLSEELLKIYFSKRKKIVDDNNLEEFKTQFNQARKLYDASVDFLSSIDEITSNSENHKLHQLERSTDAELDLLNTKYAAEIDGKNLSEAQKLSIDKKYAKLRYDVELKLFNEEEKIKKRQFQRDKALKVAQAISSTAVAVVESWKNTGGFPLGGWAAAAMLGVGLANIATILSTRYEGGTPPTMDKFAGSGGSASGGFSGGFGTGTDGLSPNNKTTLVGNMANLNDLNGPIPLAEKKTEQVITVKAVVVETDITGMQGQIKKIEEGAGI